MGVSEGADLQATRLMARAATTDRAAATKRRGVEAAQEFASLLIEQLLDSMQSTVPGDGPGSGGSITGAAIYRGIAHEALALELARTGQLGLTELMTEGDTATAQVSPDGKK